MLPIIYLGLLAGDGFGAIDVTWSAGLEADSNVSVIEIDTQTAEGDESAVFELGLEWSADLRENTGFKVGYDLSTDQYDTFDNFNTTTHRFSAEVNQTIGAARVGVVGNYVASRLGGDGFINLTRVSPYVQSYFGDRQYLLRGSYIYTDKDFVDRIDRDAEAQAVSADVYRFFDGARRYVSLGVRYTTEDTVADEFDFDATLIKVAAVQRFTVFDRSSRLRVGGRWQARDYQNVTPSIGEIRADDRYRAEASLETDITKSLFVRGEVRYNNNVSNLPAADFDETVVAISIGGSIF